MIETNERHARMHAWGSGGLVQTMRVIATIGHL